MNYLQLCQKVARESGTVSGVAPSTVVSQTGRLLKIVNWTDDAWKWVQNEHAAWRWMRKEFSKETTSGTKRYPPAAWSLNDFGHWLTDEICLRGVSRDYYPVSLYLTATGVADEGPIRQIDYSLWRHRYGRGSQTNQRPVSYAISPLNEFCPGPTPDATYTINGEYYRDAQSMSGNTDTPELPTRFHDVIVWRALELLAEFDEAPLAIGAARNKRNIVMSELERDQLETVEIGCGPLA